MDKNANTPLYLQVQKHFIDKIVSGELSPNDRLPTEAEVIDEFGVSRITVVRAFTRMAEEGWIYRIPRRGTFVCENLPPAQKSAAEQETYGSQATIITLSGEGESGDGIIGLVIPSIDGYFAIRLIIGIQKELKMRGFTLVIKISDNCRMQEENDIRDLIRMGVAGLIIFPGPQEVYNEEILNLKAQKFPFVLVDRYLPRVETNYVCSNNALGARLAVSHLWELGHRRIAIASNTPQPTVSIDNRIEGYVEEFKARGAMVDPAMFLTDVELQSLDQINEKHPLFRYVRAGHATAYLSLGGSMALSLTYIAQKLGLRVPEDISIITFDNPLPENHGEFVHYTHVDQLEERMGQEAAKIIADILGDRKAEMRYRKLVLDPVFVVGETTAVVKAMVSQ